MDFFQEIDLTQEQAEVIARGMYAVARAEKGVHERELALIQSFFGDVVGGRSISTLGGGVDLDPKSAAATLTGDASRLFVKSCLLIAYVDNEYGANEKKTVEKYASALGIKADELATLEQSVREYLLSQLSHLANTEAVVQVARQLKV